MSRHRYVRNMVLNDDYEDDYDDYDDYEEEEGGSSANNKYLYDRNSLSANYYNYLTDSGRNSPTAQKIEEVEEESISDNAKATSPIVRNLTAPVLQKSKTSTKPAPSASQSNNSTPKRNFSKNQLNSECSTSLGTRPNSEVDLSAFRRNQLQNLAKAPVVTRKIQKREFGKELVNLIVVGHVDAGKSTLMGHLLYDLEYVDTRTMDKYKHEAMKHGKSSFHFAWVLDETEEERERGVTMDVARTSFETETKRIVLLDAPGHKDFISNMITGTSQADAAILVVNGTRGEFETGFENGGQTKEHALLLRSLGVTQLIVAINKLDTVDWSFERFEEIQNVLKVFLTKQAGFSKPKFVPVSGLSGENLTKRFEPSSTPAKWYKGPCLLELIDQFVAPQPPSDGPLRIVISDVLKVTSNQLVVSGKVESGEVEKDDKIYIMPSVAAATVKACSNNDTTLDHCLAGDYALLTLTGSFEPDSIQTGSVLVRSGPDTLIPSKRFTVRLVVFEVAMPIIKGAKAEVYAHSICVPCHFVKLINTINKSNGEVLKNRPRFLSKGQSALVEIETEHDIAIEPFIRCRALGRVTFRSGGQTIAAGIVESVQKLE